MISGYLFDIVILLLASVSVISIFHKAGLGGVPGYLVAGVIVGPAGFSLIDNTEAISHFAEIGVVLLLFLIGIELKPARLWMMRTQVFGLGSLQIIVTSILISALAIITFDVPLKAGILLGPALALSSTAFVLQILTENKMLSSRYGRSSFAILLMQDVAVVPLLAAIPLLASDHMSISSHIVFDLLLILALVGALATVGRFALHYILHRVAQTGSTDNFTATALLIVLGIAIATEHAGLSMAMGAFLAGLLISDSAYRHQVSAEIQPFRGLLLGLFFMSMGMSLNLELLIEKPLASALIVVTLMTVKIVVLFILCGLFKLGRINSLAAALTLSQSGEFALVLFAIANQQALISDGLFQQMLLTVLLSMLATPPLATWARKMVQQQRQHVEREHEAPTEAPIVIAGFGRVGIRIGEILNNIGQPFVALDKNPILVDKYRKEGFPVYYGDVCKPELLRAAGAENANSIIITVNEVEAAEALIESLRQKYPFKKIFARGHSLESSQELTLLGASGVVCENIDVSIDLAKLALENEGCEQERLEKHLVRAKEKYQKLIAFPHLKDELS